MGFLTIITPTLIVIMVLAFLFELMDASFGIGFGTTFTPILLIIGFTVYAIVPSILTAEVVAGIVAMIFHALLKNVRLGQKRVFRRHRRRRKAKAYSLPNGVMAKASSASKPDEIESEEDIEEEIIIEDDNEIEIGEFDEIKEVKLKKGSLIEQIRNLTTDSKIILVLASVGILTSIVAVIINVIFIENVYFNLGVKIYIGIMVLSMGVLTLALRKKKIKFSMKRIIALGAISGFNKGLSGGGYRPVTVAGQMLTGREGKRALASSIFSKTAVSFVGVLTYIIAHLFVDRSIGESISWDFLELAPVLIIGKTLAAPLGALIVKKVDSKWLKVFVGYGTIVLGILSLVRITLDHYGIWEIIEKHLTVELFVI